MNHLRKRIDANGDGVTGSVTDDYDYDPIGRLRNYTVSAPAVPGLQRTVSLQYNALGSVLYKSDVGTYSYPASGPGVVRPHALTSVSGAIPASYTYDANGNLTVASAGSYRKISYTSFNLPDGQNGLEGPNGYPRYSWQYDENHQRVKETRVGSSGTRVTWMMHPDNAGGLGFESEQNGSSISNRHYLSIGGASLGVLVTTGSLPALGAGQMAPWIPPSLVIVKLEYWHKDLQGSLVSTTDHNGTLTARYSYDPFGKRRTASGNYDASGKLVYDWNNTSSGTDRGYTGHEHLDDVGVIHMNGRIFDPRLGMFMQGDPFIQDPMNLQNYNRYAYCYNNPMTCTDPSGHLSLGRLIRNVANLGLFVAVPLGYLAARAVARTKVGYQLGSVAISIVSVVFCEGGAAACNAVGQAAWAGFSGQSLMSSVRVGLVSGATSVAMNAVGSTWAGAATDGHSATSVFMNTAGHAAVGCGSAVANGGSCRSGAMSGTFSAAWGNYGPGYAAGQTAGIIAQNTVTAAIVGGASSKLGGGEFWNGAQTGAFGYLFNQAMHEAGCQQGCGRSGLSKGPFMDKLINFFNSFSSNMNYAVQGSAELPRLNMTVGYGSSVHLGPVGYSMDSGFAADTNLNFCSYVTKCYTVGMGATISHGTVYSVGGGLLSSGSTDYGGAFWTGGNGALGSAQILTDKNGNIVYGRGVGGAGYGAAGGALLCTMKTSCFR
ncbi:tRNA nuclease WapA [Janthinobacterium sp. AD80]|nr:tRNA nuclease WapA [Janthinobacterium sp. AD80]